jgi:pectate lyase-like protein
MDIPLPCVLLMPNNAVRRANSGESDGATMLVSSKARTWARGSLVGSIVLGACFVSHAAPSTAGEGCAEAPASSVVVDVKQKGAKGDGETDDTAAIQAAIDEVAGTGGTVFVPDGTYMVVAAAGKKRLALKSEMTLKLAKSATLKAIPNAAAKYSVLWISGVSNVTVTGGTLEGDREEHKGKAGAWGMGIHINRGARHVTISELTSKKMWGDGFYVQGAKDVRFCSVIADNNRRQGLSIIDAEGLLVSNSIFKNTRGTRPGAGIDFEPDDAEQKVTDVRIETSQFIGNEGPGILIAGKRGAVARVELTRNMFKGNRAIVVKNAPQVLSSAICDNRQLATEEAPSQGLNSFVDPIDLVIHQNDCGEGRDLRFEEKKQNNKSKKASKQAR